MFEGQANTDHVGIRVDPDHGGLLLDVVRRAPPGLVLENFGGGCTRLVCGGEPLLWARVEPQYQGLSFVRRRGVTSAAILPPVQAHEARSITSATGWMKWFLRGIEASTNTPWYTGEWNLTELRQQRASVSDIARGTAPDVYLPVNRDGWPCVVYGLRGALEIPRTHYESWGINGSGAVIPLRAPSAVDSSRVKAWRKHAREGSLPPVLLWWVTAFDVYLLIDGHDRLLAAQAEGVQPSAIGLWVSERPDPADAEVWRRSAAERYEVAFAHEESLSASTRTQLNDRLVRAYDVKAVRASKARFVKDASEQWLAEVARELADSPEDLAKLGVERDESGLRFGKWQRGD